MLRTLGLLVTAVVIVAAVSGCASKTATSESGSSPSSATATSGSSASTTATTDYSRSRNWLSTPKRADKPVDVFYLYPTSYQKKSPSSPNIGSVDDWRMRWAAGNAFKRQASAFEPSANIYAPYYRQADAGYALKLPIAEQDRVVGGIPTSDATAAFEYYLEHYNGGRPFILAGHSQGSNVLLFLLSDYMREHPDVYKRMIAAYVVGYSVTPKFLAENPHLKFAEGRHDTGVIASWNTEAPTIGGPNPVLHPNALAINPITWTRDETTATAEQNLGSIELHKTGSPIDGPSGTPQKVIDYADARVDAKKGVVICSTAPVAKLAPGNATFPRGVFHSFDYPFYYFDVRQNAADRIAAFEKK
ncbi:MAG: DUF3089 domain-containing protein [Coriobacteriales bacterium]|nr:DUF3089 domain-containing protein [Coriobacteriales bacterium]